MNTRGFAELSTHFTSLRRTRDRSGCRVAAKSGTSVCAGFDSCHRVLRAGVEYGSARQQRNDRCRADQLRFREKLTGIGGTCGSAVIDGRLSRGQRASPLAGGGPTASAMRVHVFATAADPLVRRASTPGKAMYNGSGKHRRREQATRTQSERIDATIGCLASLAGRVASVSADSQGAASRQSTSS